VNHGRTLIYVVAPSASGKSTASVVLAEALGLPVVKADHVYGELKERFDVPVTAEAITDFEMWEDPRNFGIESWGSHESIHEAKVACYAELLRPMGESSVILEGFTLSFALERLIVETLLKPDVTIVIRIELDFERWARQYEAKYGVSAVEKRQVLAYLNSKYQRREGDIIVSCQTPEEIHSPEMVEFLRRVI
jgi:hypothetical protein